MEAVLQQRFTRQRDLIERFFSELKHFHRIANRYDKLAANFLADPALLNRLYLRANESTAKLGN